jgi:hypothetical protein
MKVLFTILFLSLVQQIFAQANNRAVRDSTTYDIGGVTRKGSPGAYLYFSANTSDDGRITRGVADFNGDSVGGHGWKVLINWQEEFTLRTDTAITSMINLVHVIRLIFIFSTKTTRQSGTRLSTHIFTLLLIISFLVALARGCQLQPS